MRTNRTKNYVLCAMFVALIIVGAFIRIPVPLVPFTLQFLFTMLAGLLLGGRLWALTLCWGFWDCPCLRRAEDYPMY